MNFDSLKLEYFSHKLQLVFFKKTGELIDTCNSIVNFKKGSNLYGQVVFLESIQDSINKMGKDDTLDFTCVSNPFDNDCAYDFSFELNEKEEVVWCIHDYTPQYNRLRDLQQGRNENVIRKEKLKTLNKKLSLEKQLIKEQKDFSGVDKGSSIFIKIDSLLVNFNIKDICLAEAYGDYVKIMDSNKQYHIVYSTLKKVEDKLPPSDFARVHRSFVVRLDAIDNVDNHNMIINDKVVPISKKYKAEFMERLNTL